MEKLALITGGSSGIGLAIASELAARGYSLLIISNRKAELEEASQNLILKYNVECFCFEIDLANADSSKQVYEYCLQNKFYPEVIVNNAGTLSVTSLVNYTDAQTRAMLQLHVISTTLLCGYFARHMMEVKKGFILNVSSISSAMPYPGIAVYGASKNYVRVFTRALRSELILYNINVCCLIPGATDTSLYDAQTINKNGLKRWHLMHTAKYVGQKAVEALMKNRPECVPGLFNKLVLQLVKIIPTRLIQFIYARTNIIPKHPPGNQPA